MHIIHGSQTLVTYSMNHEIIRSSFDEHYHLVVPSNPSYKNVTFYEMFQDTKQLTLNLTSNQKPVLRQCYILPFFNPIKPHFRPIDCHKQILKYFICEKPITIGLTSPDMVVPFERYGLFRCINGQIISTLFICDGCKDCSDGDDEFNCYCFINSQRIIYFYQKNISIDFHFYIHYKSFTCSMLFNKLMENKNFRTEFKNVYLYKNSTFKIDITFINDLVFDCPYNDDDENDLLDDVTDNTMRCCEKLCMNVILDIADATQEIKNVFTTLQKIHKS